MAMNTIRLHPLMLLPTALAAAALAIVQFFTRRRKGRIAPSGEIEY